MSTSSKSLLAYIGTMTASMSAIGYLLIADGIATNKADAQIISQTNAAVETKTIQMARTFRACAEGAIFNQCEAGEIIKLPTPTQSGELLIVSTGFGSRPVFDENNGKKYPVFAR